MYLINKRTNQVSKDESKYATPGWLVCTEQEYTEALEAQNAELVEALEAVVELATHLFSAIPYGSNPYAAGYPEQVIEAARAAIKAANG
jgi:hypothetical protein